MAKTKKRPLGPEALAQVAARFKVLSDPLRLRILQQLEEGEMSVGQITEAVESNQPNVSKHLKALQEVGFLGRRQEGNSVFYYIADPSVFEICDVVCTGIRERLATQAEAFS